MKIGIMGGTFDPPHFGHLYAAKAAYEAAKLDHILFIPNGVPAYKASEGRVTGKEHRYAMVQRLIAEVSWCELSGIECEREGNTYTADTLLELTGENPDIQYELIVGSDSLKEMKHWYHPEIIFRLAGVIVLLRNQDTAETLVQTVKRYETEYRKTGNLFDTDPQKGEERGAAYRSGSGGCGAVYCRTQTVSLECTDYNID